ncbi:Specifically androgen-regulated gene protein [Galemys pyrenaicus]|uniref:Specifically androgen-regulated gene protein n=1 Tax=Galemys pyrenaicus TaxID=202257 RepID=A0A8J6DDZ5_GALPY|nr:Specifically androgen-regulated gene protein [Galemys pyrenaicus]
MREGAAIRLLACSAKRRCPVSGSLGRDGQSQSLSAAVPRRDQAEKGAWARVFATMEDHPVVKRNRLRRQKPARLPRPPSSLHDVQASGRELRGHAVPAVGAYRVAAELASAQSGTGGAGGTGLARATPCCLGVPARVLQGAGATPRSVAEAVGMSQATPCSLAVAWDPPRSPRPPGSPACTSLRAMPEKERWPAVPGSSSLDRMMSNVSTRSASSDSSYDFLSAEEKACLRFLEETIGSLDAEADSGVSTDESAQAPAPQGPPALPAPQPVPQGKRRHGQHLERNPGAEVLRALPAACPPLGRGVSVPLARRLAVAQRASGSSGGGGRGWRQGRRGGPRRLGATGPAAVGSRPECGRREAPRLVVLGAQWALPQAAAARAREGPALAEAEARGVRAPCRPSPAPSACPDPPGRPVDPAPQRGPQSRALTPPSPLRPPAPQGLGLWSGSHSLPRNIHIGRNQRLGSGTAQTPVLRPSEGVVPAPRAEQGLGPQEASDSDVVPPPEAFRDSRPTAPREQSHVPQSPAALGPPEHGAPAPEAMSQAAKEQGQPALPGAQSSRDLRGAPVPAGAHPEAQQGPATAPKPRKLPPNIVLKSSRGSLRAEPQHRLSRPAEAPGDAEHRRARREALEKLGLPQDQEDPSAHPSRPRPGGSLELREPPAPARGSPLGSAQGPALGPGQTPGPEPAPGRATPAPGPTLLCKGAPGLQQTGVKASTLERSGVGLGSALVKEGARPAQASSCPGKGAFLDKLSPQVLRNSRPRPASLGTGRDFEGIQVGRLADLEQEQSAPRAPRHGQSRDKLPRPICVSVKIAPRGVPAEHRREALRKLGLLKE